MPIAAGGDQSTLASAGAIASGSGFVSITDLATDGLIRDFRRAISARSALALQSVYQLKISDHVEQVGYFRSNPPW